MDLMDLVAERVKIMKEGQWEEGQIKITLDDANLPHVSDEMKKVALIRFTKRKSKNPRLFDGDAFHLNMRHSIIKPDSVSLAVGKIKYSIYDIARADFAKKYGWMDLPTGMGINAVILAADAKIVVADRFGFGVDHSAKVNVVGGVYSGGHPFDCIRGEITDELAIERKEIEKLILIGISDRLDERQNHELTFLVRTALSSAQIAEKEATVEKKEGRVFFLSESPGELRDYLEENHAKILSSGFAALVVAGRHLWKKKWSKIPTYNIMS